MSSQNHADMNSLPHKHLLNNKKNPHNHHLLDIHIDIVHSDKEYLRDKLLLHNYHHKIHPGMFDWGSSRYWCCRVFVKYIHLDGSINLEYIVEFNIYQCMYPHYILHTVHSQHYYYIQIGIAHSHKEHLLDKLQLHNCPPHIADQHKYTQINSVDYDSIYTDLSDMGLDTS